MARPDYQLLRIKEEAREHAHAYAQILLPLHSALELRVNGQIHHISQTELAFLAPDIRHQCLCKGELIVINIPASMIKKGDLEILGSKTAIPIAGPLIPLTQLIAEDIKHNNSSMRYLYYYLYDRLVQSNSFRSMRYIREHFDEPITVSQLAKLENFSVAHYNDWFKKQTGYTPSHYLKLYRIEKAKELLLYSDYNITDIALQVGYDSHASFTRAFCKTAGIPPLRYRVTAGKGRDETGGETCTF